MNTMLRSVVSPIARVPVGARRALLNRPIRTNVTTRGLKSMSASEASTMLDGPYQYLDVRTVEEFSGGHAPGAVNIPIMNSGPGGMTLNATFAAQVSAEFASKDTALIVGCKAGMRSIKAISVLEEMKYSELVNLTGGFDAWASSGLPVTK